MRPTFIALALTLGLAGCGDTLDERGQRLATTGAGLTNSLEHALSASSYAMEVEPGAREDLQTAADVINTIFGSCLKITTAAAPAYGLDLAFAKDGCGIPFTPIDFRGSLGVRVLDIDEQTHVTVAFDGLRVPSVALDGSADFRRTQDRFTYRFDKLRGEISDKRILLDGTGEARFNSLHSTSDFSGTGTVVYDDLSFGFRATGIHRDYVTDCYPASGTLEIWFVEGGQTYTAVMHFTDDETSDDGNVRVEFNGKTVDWDLPQRSCE